MIVQALLRDRPPKLELRLHRRRKVLENGDLPLAPAPRPFVDRAHRSDRVAVGEHQRNARVGNHVEVAYREVVGDERVLAGIGDDERLLRVDRVLAEGMAQGRLTRLRELAGQAVLALEELPARVDERDQ